MNRMIVLVLAAAIVGGCGQSGTTTYEDDKGNKVEVGAGGTKVTSTDPEGKKTVVESDAGGTHIESTGPDGKKTSVETEGGKVKVTDEAGGSTTDVGHGVSESDLVVAVYPGSTQSPERCMKAETPDEKSALGVYMSPDEPAKVMEFYKPKLEKATVTDMRAPDADVRMVTGKLGEMTAVTVSAARPRKGSATEITISVVTKKKPAG